MIELWHNCSLFSPPYFFEFSKYSTENMHCFYNWTERTMLTIFRNQSSTALSMWESSQDLILGQHQWKGLRNARGHSSRGCHIWKPSMRVTSHWNLVKINLAARAGRDLWIKTWRVESPRKNRPKEDNLWALASTTPVYLFGLISRFSSLLSF